MAKRHNRRQRKKLQIGEFRELGFEVSADLTRQLNDDERDALLDAFLEQCIEPNSMAFGGGINVTLSGYIVATGARASATDLQRELVQTWLYARSEFSRVEVSPLEDAWHGHD